MYLLLCSFDFDFDFAFDLDFDFDFDSIFRKQTFIGALVLHMSVLERQSWDPASDRGGPAA